jgi:hypothetical protein
MDRLPISGRRTMKAKAGIPVETASRKRIRRGIEGWRTLILQQRTSGETVQAFCAARAIPRSSFSKWRQRLAAPTPAARFLPVAVRSASAASVSLGERPDPVPMRVSRSAANRLLDAIIARLAESL